MPVCSVIKVQRTQSRTSCEEMNCSECISVMPKLKPIYWKLCGCSNKKQMHPPQLSLQNVAASEEMLIAKKQKLMRISCISKNTTRSSYYLEDTEVQNHIVLYSQITVPQTWLQYTICCSTGLLSEKFQKCKNDPNVKYTVSTQIYRPTSVIRKVRKKKKKLIQNVSQMKKGLRLGLNMHFIMLAALVTPCSMLACR